MFNKKLKQQIKQLMSDNHDLSSTIAILSEENAALKKTLNAQGTLISYFADYIVSNIKKKGAKHGKKK